MLNTEHKKDIGYSVSTVFFFFFLKVIFDKSALQDHILFHIQMGPLVVLTPHGDPGGGGVL